MAAPMVQIWARTRRRRVPHPLGKPSPPSGPVRHLGERERHLDARDRTDDGEII